MRGHVQIPSGMKLVLGLEEQVSRAGCMMSPMPRTKGAGRKADGAFEPQRVGFSWIARLKTRFYKYQLVEYVLDT